MALKGKDVTALSRGKNGAVVKKKNISENTYFSS